MNKNVLKRLSLTISVLFTGIGLAACQSGTSANVSPFVNTAATPAASNPPAHNNTTPNTPSHNGTTDNSAADNSTADNSTADNSAANNDTANPSGTTNSDPAPDEPKESPKAPPISAQDIAPVELEPLALTCGDQPACAEGEHPDVHLFHSPGNDMHVDQTFKKIVNEALTKADETARAASTEKQRLVFGIDGTLTGDGSELDFFFDKTTAKKIDKNLDAKLIITANIDGASELTIGSGYTTELLSNTINTSVNLTEKSDVYVSAQFNKNLKNQGTLHVLPPLEAKTGYDISGGKRPGSTIIDYKVVKLDDQHTAYVSAPSILVKGDFVQSTSGKLKSDLGYLQVDGDITLGGSIYYGMNPINFSPSLARIILLSKKKFDVFNTTFIGEPINTPELKYENDNFRYISSMYNPLIEFKIGEETHYALVVYPNGNDAQQLLLQDFTDTYVKNTKSISKKCKQYCSSKSGIQSYNKALKGADLEAKLPTSASTKNQPSAVFKAKVGSSHDKDSTVTFQKVASGQAGVVFMDNLYAQQFTLQAGTKVLLAQSTVYGNVTLEASEADVNGDKAAYRRPELMANAQITGNLTNRHGLVTVIVNRYYKTLQNMYEDQHSYKRDAYLVNISSLSQDGVPLRTLSLPVGLIVKGDYVQEGSATADSLRLSSGILMVNGKATLTSGRIQTRYVPNPKARSATERYASLLLVSGQRIALSDAITVCHQEENQACVADQKPVEVQLNDDLYALVVEFATPKTEGSANGTETATRAVKHQSNSGLMKALTAVKDPTVILPVVGSSEKRMIRVAMPTTLGLLRNALVGIQDKDWPRYQTWTGNFLSNVDSAATRTQLLLDNRTMSDLLTGISTQKSAPAVQVGFDTHLLFGQGQWLSSAQQLHVMARQGNWTARLGGNLVTLRQNLAYSDNNTQKVGSKQLSHSLGYGVQAGLKAQLPSQPDMALAFQVGYERFTHKIKLNAPESTAQELSPELKSSTLSLSLLASKTFGFAAWQNPGDFLQVQPYAGYRYQQLNTDEMALTLAPYTLQIKAGAFRSNSLMAGVKLNYLNAFSTQGLGLHARVHAALSLNKVQQHQLSLMANGASTEAYNADGKTPGAFNAQLDLGVSYQIQAVDLGVRTELLYQDRMVGGMSGYVHVQF